MDIGPALTSITASVSLVRAVIETSNALDRAELKARMAEVIVSLADAKTALVDAQSEIASKDDEIRRLKDAFARREETVEVNGHRYSKGADGKPDGRAFCPRCLEVDGRLIRVERAGQVRGAMNCPQCKAAYHHLTEYPIR
jgi:hypothetical protein